MSYVIGSADYQNFATAMLPGMKEHLRVDFDDDDETIKRYTRWATAYLENELGFRIATAHVVWSPIVVVGVSRYQCPVQPVTDFTAADSSGDVSGQYVLEPGLNPILPSWLVKIDGGDFPAGIVIDLTTGSDDPTTLPPNVEAGIYRVAGTLYEHRESITALSLEGMPFWLRDLLDGAWIPRA